MERLDALLSQLQLLSNPYRTFEHDDRVVSKYWMPLKNQSVGEAHGPRRHLTASRPTAAALCGDLKFWVP